MTRAKRSVLRALLLLSILWLGDPPAYGQESVPLTIRWDHEVRVSRTTATLQVVVNPPLRRGTAIHDRVFQALRDLGCDYVRYVPWLPYPRLGVAELEPPKEGTTSRDFSQVDPLTIDFLEATRGHSVILNFSIIPQWMFKTEKPVTYPSDPDQVIWNYQQGTELRDPTMKEVADYYGRLVSWYTQGGFTDEYGKRHDSGYHYKIDSWEVLNEVDSEHKMTPEFYTRLYDAIVEAIRGVQPQMKFVGMALAAPSKDPGFFEYFLDHNHHKPGIPLDMISYHFYASPAADEDPEAWQYTFFEQADHFLDVVRYVESIRQRRSLETRTTINEIGAILPNDNVVPRAPIPDFYWNLCAAEYAYLYAQLAGLGVEVAGESQLVGYPTQFPSVSMVDWTTGRPNARTWALKLLRDNFGPGDKLVEINSGDPSIYALGFEKPDGWRKVLLVNKRNRPRLVSIPSAAGADVEFVDQTTGLNPPAELKLAGDQLNLNGFSVSVVSLPK